MMRDPVDLDLIQYENRCERIDDRDALANKADSANDEPTYEEAKRAAAAAYSAQFIGTHALWALRGLK